jgi:pilus assembly protein Flp/PilA
MNTCKVKEAVLGFVHDESGQDLIEYALVAALLGLGAVASLKSLATTVGKAFTTIGKELTSNV